MRSIFKKIAGAVLTASLALGFIGCSADSSDNMALLFAGQAGSSSVKKVATPTFSVASGEVESGTIVTISCETEDATIYYTTNGDEPTTESTKYTAAISLTTAITIKAIAVKDGLNDSEVASVSYTIKGVVATPVFSVTSGGVENGEQVEITCATEGAKIYYTADGSEPTASSTEYSSAITIEPPKTIKAIAVKEGLSNSVVATAEYTVKQTVATPTLSVEAGAVVKGTSLEISCETEGVTIYYTTNGVTPTTESAEYTAAITIVPPMTVKAFAVKDRMYDSAVVSAEYTFKAKYAIGDIVLKDGTVCKPADYEEGSDTAAAVIFRGDTATVSALGVGVKQAEPGVAWCLRYIDEAKTKTTVGQFCEITDLRARERSGPDKCTTGSNSWEILQRYCSDAKDHPEYYPAFKYSLDYGTNNNLGEAIASGWYLPAYAEVKLIYDNRVTVDASLEKAGGDKFGTNSYWTCCQKRDICSSAVVVYFNNGSDSYSDRYEDKYQSTCSIRAFD